MSEINWEEPYCGEGNNCFRLGTDSDGNGFIAVLGQEERYVADSRGALQQMIRDIKAGKADHLL
ncbi:hypothetical protein ACIQOF_18325 [Streptomyces sp. NPDC091265]|uniref:hypothetical protein n=1 Tax=unclassified Streptomyces TaxID=2593676 RepID=UPI00344E21D4